MVQIIRLVPGSGGGSAKTHTQAAPFSVIPPACVRRMDFLLPKMTGRVDPQPSAAGIWKISGKMFRSQSMWLKLSAMGAVLLLSVWHSRSASSEVPEGTWMFANRVALQIFECTGQLCGRIVWLLRPRTPAGQPDLDTLNPDPSLRQRHLCGLTAGHWRWWTHRHVLTQWPARLLFRELDVKLATN